MMIKKRKSLIIFLLLALILFRHTIISLAENSVNPLEAQKHNSTGMEFLAKKNYESAYRSFQAAIRHNPAVKYYHNNLAVACMNLKKYEEAIAHLQKAIDIDPTYVKALSNRAICHFRLAQYRLAFMYYRKALLSDSAYTENRFKQEKMIREMEHIQKSRPHDSQLREIIDRARKLEKQP